MGSTGELIVGSHTEWQTKALSGHHQHRTEDLRHVVIIDEDQDIFYTHCQPNLGGKDFNIVPRTSARPRPLGNDVYFLAHFGTQRRQSGPGEHAERGAREHDQHPMTWTNAHSHSIYRIHAVRARNQTLSRAIDATACSR